MKQDDGKVIGMNESTDYFFIGDIFLYGHIIFL